MPLDLLELHNILLYPDVPVSPSFAFTQTFTLQYLLSNLPCREKVWKKLAVFSPVLFFPFSFPFSSLFFLFTFFSYFPNLFVRSKPQISIRKNWLAVDWFYLYPNMSIPNISIWIYIYIMYIYLHLFDWISRLCLLIHIKNHTVKSSSYHALSILCTGKA